MRRAILSRNIMGLTRITDQDGSDDMDPALFASKAQVLFGENYPRMQKLKKEHDPENIFSKWFPITPAA